MALPLFMVYECNNLLGHLDNPGGYDGVTYPGGVDQSQGAVVKVYTDLVVDAVLNTKLTSVARPFVANDKGNTLRVTSGAGWTIGTYIIASVTGGAATLDRSPAATGTTGGNGRFGGANSNFYRLNNHNLPVGNTVWWKQTGTKYSWIEDGSNGLPVATSGSALNRNVLEGYGTTRGDGVRVELEGIVSRDADFDISGNFWTFRNLELDALNRLSRLTPSGENLRFENVIITNVNGTAITATGFRNQFRRVRSHGNVGSGIQLQSQGGTANQGLDLEFCEFDHNGAAGIVQGDGGHDYIRNTIVHHNTTDGVIIGNGSRFGSKWVNCTIADNTLDGFRFDGTENVTGSIGTHLFERCIIANNGGYGIEMEAGWTDLSSTKWQWFRTHFQHNAFYNNTSGDYFNFAGNATEDIILSADPFTDAASFDYALNAEVGGGLDLRMETAQAQVFSGATSYVHFGAIEVAGSAAPVAPAALTAVEGTGGVILNWTDNSTNEDGFVIERKIGAGAFTVLDTVVTDIVTYTDTTTSPDTEYTYRVKASSTGGSSGYSNEATLTTAPADVGAPTPPDIDEVLFPPDISRGAVGGDMFTTIVVNGSTGVEQRNENWDVPRMEWEVSHGLRSPEEGRELKAFFLNRRGKARGFRFKNWDDYSAENEVLTVTGTKTVQTTKTYSDGVFDFVKNLFKLTEDDTPFTMRRNGSPFTDFTVDLTTGIITLDADASFSISAITKAATAVITVTAHSFTVGQYVYIEGVNGMTQINGQTVGIIATGANTITVALDTTVYSTYTSGGTAAKYVQPTEVLDWSGEFHIPCRFDTDQMRLSLTDSFIREWNDIPVVELIA